MTETRGAQIFHTEGPQILGATVQNLVARTSGVHSYVHIWIRQCPDNLQIRFRLTGVCMYICNAELIGDALPKRGQIRLWGCRLLIPVTVEIMGI